jgi:hypothetical protein
MIKKKRHGLFRRREKWPDPTMCERCGALFEKGRWTWNKTDEEVYKTTCPACRRIAGNHPAGYVEIRGGFFYDHRQEIVNLIENVEKQQKSERPLERLISMQDLAEYTLVTTTGIHIARRIGEALARAYQGEMNFQYADGDKQIRVYWERD